jgi:hypothetical protein
MLQLARNAFDIAWLDAADRARYLGDIEAYARSARG